MMNRGDFYFSLILIFSAGLLTTVFIWAKYNYNENEPKRIAIAKEHTASWAKETSVEYKAITCNDKGYCAINTGSNIIDIYCSPNEEDRVYCVLNPNMR